MPRSFKQKTGYLILLTPLLSIAPAQAQQSRLRPQNSCLASHQAFLKPFVEHYHGPR